MKISLNELEKAIKESLNKVMVNEALLTEVQVKKDNFDFWANYIDDFIKKNGQNDDLVWYIQVMQRMKDNPGMQKQNYHAGANYGTFADGGAITVHNGAELQQAKAQIIQYCDAKNARAVIFANPRSESAVNNFLPTYRARSGGNVNDPRYVNAKEILMGQIKHDPKKFPGRKVCKFDIDETDPRVKKLAKIIIQYYDPNAIIVDDTNAGNSPSGGLHIGISDGYAPYVKEMIEMLRIADAKPKRSGGRDFFPDEGFKQTIHFNPDANFILYSNVNTPGYHP